jgi:cobalt/nickel transport system permease protein
MSRRSYTRHIPDFRLVTHFGESGRSAVHRANPWTKAVLLGVVVALATVLMDVALLAALLVATLATYLLAGLPIRVLIGWYTLPVMFVVTLTLLFVFSEPGEEIIGLSLWGSRVSITDNGLLLVAKLLLRALAVVTFSLTVFMTTKYGQVASLAHRTMPRTLAAMFLLSYRFLFVTADEVSELLDAMHARNGGLVKGMTRQSRLFAGIFGHAFIHAFERGERISKAMESRAFTGEFPVTERLPRPSAGGMAMLAAALAAVALSAYARYSDFDLMRWW